MARTRALDRWVAILAAALAAALATAQHASAQSQALKLSTAQGPAYPLGKAGEIWAARISERSGGRLAVTHFPGATLSSRDASREFGGLRDGAFQLAVGSTLAWAAQVPQLNVLALPWLVPGESELEALLGGTVGGRLAAVLEGSGAIVVAWAANGFVDLASKSPVHKPDDLAGMRIRTQGSPLVDQTLITLRAQPLAMSAADARAALESGQLDGQETNVPTFSASRLYAGPLKHLQLWGAHADALVFAVNRPVWESWNDGDRQLVREAAIDASRQAMAMSRRLADDATLGTLGAQGAVVTRLTAAGKDAFRDATLAIYDRWKPTIGAELVEAAQSEVSAAHARR